MLMYQDGEKSCNEAAEAIPGVEVGKSGSRIKRTNQLADYLEPSTIYLTKCVPWKPHDGESLMVDRLGRENCSCA